MPQIYSDEEKKEIIERLKKEANILMQEKGVKKTTVDELVKREGIPKGTFYLFYPSKEMLLYDVSQFSKRRKSPGGTGLSYEYLCNMPMMDIA